MYLEDIKNNKGLIKELDELKNHKKPLSFQDICRVNAYNRLLNGEKINREDELRILWGDSKEWRSK